MDHFMTLKSKIFNEQLKEVPIKTEIIGKEHYWQNENLSKKEFYFLPGYFGTFQLKKSREMGYLLYVEHTCERRDPLMGAAVEKLVKVTEEDLIPPKTFAMKAYVEMKKLHSRMKRLGITS